MDQYLENGIAFVEKLCSQTWAQLVTYREKRLNAYIDLELTLFAIIFVMTLSMLYSWIKAWWGIFSRRGYLRLIFKIPFVSGIVKKEILAQTHSNMLFTPFYIVTINFRFLRKF